MLDGDRSPRMDWQVGDKNPSPTASIHHPAIGVKQVTAVCRNRDVLFTCIPRGGNNPDENDITMFAARGLIELLPDTVAWSSAGSSGHARRPLNNSTPRA